MMDHPPSGTVPYLAQLRTAKYMLLTTFKRDGTPVATPVHVAVEGQRAYFRTWKPSGKWKRLRHTQRVLMAPCSDMTIMPWSPLANGLLTGKYSSHPDGERRLAPGRSRNRATERGLAMAEVVVAAHPRWRRG